MDGRGKKGNLGVSWKKQYYVQCYALEFCDKTLGTDGVYYYGNGHIRSEEDLDKLTLPDPTEDES